jgi:hypothetical protein
MEAFTADALVLNTLHPPSQQHQAIEIQEDQHQDSKEEIEVAIKNELARLRQENERMWLMQEHMARWRVVARRSQIMQQQIKQERATQAELQWAIENLH